VRLSKLYLKAFGPYTEQVIDFGGTDASLHILYGPNEAGKSSILRAIRALFFGISERTQDNFLHENAVLRIAGIVNDDKGYQLAVMRRKARKQPLREWNGNIGPDIACEGEPLSDDVMSAMMGSIGEVQFSKVFGIDRDELIAGGRAILEGQGEVGESLFEAGAGLVGLRRLREALETEADALFAPRASKPLINTTISEYNIARRDAKDLGIKTEEWVRREEAFTVALRQLNDNKQALVEWRMERERVSRILRNLPMIVHREECLKELTDLVRVPDLPLDFAEQRVAIFTAKASAQRRRDDSQVKLSELTSQLESIEIPVGYIERGVLIQGVYSRLGAFQQAELEIPGLQVKYQSLLDHAKAKLTEAGISEELPSVGKLRPKKGEEAKLRSLIKESTDYLGRLTELRRQETEAKLALEKATSQLSRLTKPRDKSPLEQAVQVASEHAESERRLSELESEIRTRMEEIERKARNLGDRTPTELRKLRLPSRTTLERLQLEVEAISSDHNLANSQLSDRRVDLAKLEAEKSRLEEGGLVPSEAELAKARERRDHGWNLVRQGYIEKTRDPDELGASFSPGVKLFEAYEAAVERADAVADGLRYDTKRMTEHSLVRERIAQLSAAIVEDQARLNHLATRQEKWEVEWTGIKLSLGVECATVRELQAWLTDQSTVVALVTELEKRQREAEGLGSGIETARRCLLAQLQAYGVVASEGETLKEALTRSRRLLEAARREEVEYEKAQKAKDELELRLAGDRERLKELQGDFQAWRSRWQLAVGAIGLNETAEPADAEGQLSLLGELFLVIDEANRIGRDLSEREATIKRYAEEVHDLVGALGIDLGERSPSHVVPELFAQYQETQKTAQRRKQISDQLEAERRAFEQADQELSVKSGELAELCNAAGVTEITGLPSVEARAKRKRELASQVSQIERQLIELNSTPLDRVLEEAASANRDSLNAQLPALEEEIKEGEALQITLAQYTRDAEVALKQVDGSARAAEAAQVVQELLARLANATEDYVRLKASSFVIARAIEAYREKNQAPLLKRAAEYFKTLTLGSFRGLEADPGEGDREVLVGVRANRKHVPVGGMSEGTRDQLYLALRLAAIERHLETGPPVPVIVDDILVQFDNKRAKAALEALGMLAAHTQVLVLTHHEHLLPLAEQATAKSALAIHRLETPSLV
jgi:exonuclease SbcC